jgi:drug/metabolite transporter (DMT)-like permease
VSPPVDEPVGWDEFDTPAEVDAVFRTQRRIAIGHFVVFLCGVLLIPGLTLFVNWWSGGRLAGWWTTSFFVTGAGMYLFFYALGLAASSLATGVERRMLGSPQSDAARDPDR